MKLLIVTLYASVLATVLLSPVHAQYGEDDEFDDFEHPVDPVLDPEMEASKSMPEPAEEPASEPEPVPEQQVPEPAEEPASEPEPLPEQQVPEPAEEPASEPEQVPESTEESESQNAYNPDEDFSKEMEQDLDEAALLAINARKARDAAVKAVEEKKKESEQKAEEKLKKQMKETEIKADGSVPNKVQYTRRLKNMKYAGKDYPEVIEVGFYLPPGYKVGEKIRIKGRSARRAGSEEAADFLNRESGHTVLDVRANKNNVGGNGGWVVIESMEGSKPHEFVGGNTNEHTADGANGYKYEL